MPLTTSPVLTTLVYLTVLGLINTLLAKFIETAFFVVFAVPIYSTV